MAGAGYSTELVEAFEAVTNEFIEFVNHCKAERKKENMNAEERMALFPRSNFISLLLHIFLLFHLTWIVIDYIFYFCLYYPFYYFLNKSRV